MPFYETVRSRSRDIRGSMVEIGCRKTKTRLSRTDSTIVLDIRNGFDNFGVNLYSNRSVRKSLSDSGRTLGWRADDGKIAKLTDYHSIIY